MIHVKDEYANHSQRKYNKGLIKLYFTKIVLKGPFWFYFIKNCVQNQIEKCIFVNNI